MSRLTREHWPNLSRGDRGDWLERFGRADRSGPGQRQSTMMVLGLVALGMGVVAWNYLGPDLKRYAKIQSM